MMDPPVGVLFVCMGNICRSPTAEAMFRHHAAEAGLIDAFNIDSAGTGGWHAGDPPDGRMHEAAMERGIELVGQARQIVPEDLNRFHHVLCMDGDNLHGVLQLGEGSAAVSLMLSHHETSGLEDVPDPYYGGARGFAHVVELLDVACRNLLQKLNDLHELEA
jgi:protein-tyrosine phosphatase